MFFRNVNNWLNKLFLISLHWAEVLPITQKCINHYVRYLRLYTPTCCAVWYMSCAIWYLTCATWYLTCASWYLTCAILDTWFVLLDTWLALLEDLGKTYSSATSTIIIIIMLEFLILLSISFITQRRIAFRGRTSNPSAAKTHAYRFPNQESWLSAKQPHFFLFYGSAPNPSPLSSLFLLSDYLAFTVGSIKKSFWKHFHFTLFQLIWGRIPFTGAVNIITQQLTCWEKARTYISVTRWDLCPTHW